MAISRLVVYGAVALSIIGMMLVVAGVVATGFFMPGVVLIGVGIVGFAAGALLYAFGPRDAGEPTPRARP